MELTTNSKNIPTTTSAVTNPIMKLYIAISSSLFCCRGSAVQEQVVQEQVRQPVTRAYALEIEDEHPPGSENVPGSPNVRSRSKRTHATMATTSGIADGMRSGDMASLEQEEHLGLQVYVSYVCIVVYFY